MEFTTRLGLHSQTTRLLRRSQPHALEPAKAFHQLWVKPRSGELRLSHARLVASLTPQFPAALNAEGFGAGLIPLHSPLLGKSWLVSFPPLSYMLKFSG